MPSGTWWHPVGSVCAGEPGFLLPGRTGRRVAQPGWGRRKQDPTGPDSSFPVNGALDTANVLVGRCDCRAGDRG